MSEIFNKLLLLRSPGIGPAKYAQLIKTFGSVSNAVEAFDVSDTVRDTVMREIEYTKHIGAVYICDTDDLYPENLRKIKNHPPVLVARGNIDTLHRPAVSIVGTRHATITGMEFITNLAQKFAEHGVALVSGMAMGTDTAAHSGALNANGNMQTIAVLAGGVDYIWPIENESLYYQIIERGVIISEMPVGYKPNATNFVQRNRLIAGIGEKLILGEADENSGSMHTARFASDYGHKIYAIPSHPADSRATGPNSLIKAGIAELCIGADDFFQKTQNVKNKQKNSKKSPTPISLIDHIGTIPVSESVLAQVCQKTISEIKSNLVILELQGLVRRVDGGYVRS
ncbi:MAG: DNA-processing protein DprA [Alphaproteobacteria bacterium]|nr:DNA-processing protein DprA [Alphaproteobacteria bacterium]